MNYNYSKTQILFTKKTFLGEERKMSTHKIRKLGAIRFSRIFH